MQRMFLWIVVIMLVTTVCLQAGEKSSHPVTNQAEWRLINAKSDETEKHEGVAVLRIEPKGSAEWRFTDRDSTGKVEFWVKETYKKPANPTAAGVGPRFMVMNSAGGTAGMGVLYAAYLGEGDAYVATKPDGPTYHAKLQWVGQNRTDQWVKWGFIVDNQRHLTIERNGVKVDRLTDTDIIGFGGIVGIRVIGDDAGDSIVYLGKATASTGIPVPPQAGQGPEGVVARTPATDPRPEGPVPTINVRTHPRLLFDENTLADIRKNSEDNPLLKESITRLTEWVVRPDSINENADIFGDHLALWHGFREYPRFAIVYALTKDQAALANIKRLLNTLLEAPYWANANDAQGNPNETDCSMGAGNLMALAAILYDTAYNDLEPDFRKKFEEKMLLHARRMYWLGYEKMWTTNTSRFYWQGDPANNHRWHRGCGQAAILLAIADKVDGRADFLLSKAKAEFEFILDNYPHDGDCHEGSAYQSFGYTYLALTAWMFDRVTGSNYLDHPGFQNAWRQQVYYGVPGKKFTIAFGDSTNRPTDADNLLAGFFIGIKHSRDKDAFAVFDRYFQSILDTTRGHWPQWIFHLFYDPTLAGGDVDKVPAQYLFADLGAVAMRDNWTDDAVAVSFKCGPYGGYALNDFRNATTPRRYINIAHDDPDANGFALASKGQFVFHPGNYSSVKWTKYASTILFDDKGQKQEGDVFTQPGADDLTTYSYLTGYKADENTNRVIVEGEAGNAYSDLNRFRRSFIFMPGDYVLILDNVVAKRAGKISWSSVVWDITPEATAGEAKIVLPENAGTVALQVVSNKPINHSTDKFVMEGRWERAGEPALVQYQVFAENTDTARFAAVVDAWGKNAKVSYTEAGDGITITVKGDGLDDVWTWAPSTDMDTPSAISGKRGGQDLFALTAEDVAPRGDPKGE